jgi:hypothetical protein
MEENNTTPSTAPGATPAVVPPATGNPAPGGATPPAAALTLEEALKKLADAEHSQRNATEEVERHRKKLSAYEKVEAEREAAKKAEADAQLSEVERVKKQHAEIQAQHNALLLELQETRITNAVERHARDLHFIHPEIAVRLLDRAELEFEDSGAPKNAQQLLEKLLKSMPELANAPAQPPASPPGPGSTTTPAAPARPSAPVIPAMNPGRSTIAQPGSTPPGRPVRLSDIRR